MVLALAATSSATLLRSAPAPVANTTQAAKGEMVIQPHKFMEVTLGPFGSSEEACDYCFGSYTKTGDPPAGPIAEACVCMAYQQNGPQEWNMFCATPPSAAGWVGGKDGGCKCKARDMA